MSAIGKQIGYLKRKIGNRRPSPDETSQLQALEENLKVATKDFLTMIEGARVEFSRPLNEKEIDNEVPDTKELQRALRDLQSQTTKKTVAVYTLIGENNFWTLIVLPNDIISVVSPIRARDLKKKVVEFSSMLNEVDAQTNTPKFSKIEVQRSGQELYNYIFAAVDAKFKDINIKPDVLMWALDGPLRYISVSALYDGKHYLGERYGNVVFTRANPKRLLAPGTRSWTGYGFYDSKQHAATLGGSVVTFPGLEHTKGELEGIFGVPPKKGVMSGEMIFDDQFTKESLLNLLKQHRPVVHIASHFRFEAGDSASSFLLLGDGNKLSLEDIKNGPEDLFKEVELLTLSACETGLQKERESDGREIDGFAELAQRKGAGAVLASLWKVDDESTSQLMTQFYRFHQVNRLSKIEALQKAQLNLLRSKDFSHPYYWSPFILVGNWR